MRGKSYNCQRLHSKADWANWEYHEGKDSWKYKIQKNTENVLYQQVTSDTRVRGTVAPTRDIVFRYEDMKMKKKRLESKDISHIKEDKRGKKVGW